jgi:hypothetical protein
MGNGAAHDNQQKNAVAVGINSGYTFQGINAIAIGDQAGYSSQPANSIVLSATGSALNGATNSIVLNAGSANVTTNNANAFYVKPIRQLSDLTGFTGLYYNPSTGEIAYM